MIGYFPTAAWATVKAVSLLTADDDGQLNAVLRSKWVQFRLRTVSTWGCGNVR